MFGRKMTSRLGFSVCCHKTAIVLVNDVVYSGTMFWKQAIFTVTNVVLATIALVYLSMHKISHTKSWELVVCVSYV